jgi:hypothetical protein
MNTHRTNHAAYEMDNREYWRSRVYDYGDFYREPRQPLWLRLLVGAAIAVALGVLLVVWR